MFKFPTPHMPIKTYVRSDDGNTYLIDTIEHEGGLWLVPQWLETTFPNMQQPARIIRMDTLPHNHVGDYLFDTNHKTYSLDGLIPKAVLDGATSSLSKPPLEIVEAPEIAIRR